MHNPAELQSRAFQHYQAGQREQAERLCWEALQFDPLHAESIYLLGVLALDAGRTHQAVLHFHHATLLEPHSAAYRLALGEAWRVRNDRPRAEACLREAVRLDPRQAAAHNALGHVLVDAGHLDEAEACLRQALALRPDYARAHNNLGRVHQSREEHEQAAACFAEAVRLQPSYALAHNNLGAARLAQGRHAEAIDCFRQALRLDPHYPEAHCNLAGALQHLGDPTAALPHFQEAVRLRPDYVKAHTGLGQALESLRRDREAAACYQTALRLDPDNRELFGKLANVLMIVGEREAAHDLLEQALGRWPDDVHLFTHLAYMRQLLCDWQHYQADEERLWRDARQRLDAGEPTPVHPMTALGLPWGNDRLLEVARSHARAIDKRQARFRAAPDRQQPRPAPGRLRVGYFSGDFYAHPIGQLLSNSLFACHDRQAFEVFAYSFGPADGSWQRRQIAADCEHFRDVAALSTADLARTIRDDGIHLLIDLMGFTGVHRMDVLALRPAPVQVSYLGMLGTTGAPFLDYLLTDPVVTPPEWADQFTENLVFLPHSYLVSRHEPPPPPAARRDLGLPEEGTVYCCFNNSYKLEPTLFALWMRLLKRVPGSVLWLYTDSTRCRDNLRRTAEEHGITSERLVFAGFVPSDKHLARQQAADLFLDTRLYNGAATAVMALAAGLPVLTCPGQTFASRVGASLLHAIGLPELIAPDLEAYEEMAVRLGSDPDARTALKAKLAAHRTTWPLFDCPRFCRNLERAYREMWHRHEAGKPPASFHVNEAQG